MRSGLIEWERVTYWDMELEECGAYMKGFAILRLPPDA